jgi:hypothetical protein
MSTRTTVEALRREARAAIVRLSPAPAAEAQRAGARRVDSRTEPVASPA